MNPKPNQEEVEKRIQEVPEELWEVAMGSGVSDEINGLSSELTLPDEKKSGLARAVGLIFLGFIHRTHFKEVLQEELGLPQEQINKLAGDINNNIFIHIDDALDDFYAQMNGDDALPTATEGLSPTLPITELDNSPVSGSALPPTSGTTSDVATPAEEETILKPHIQKEEPLAEPSASPFVLHEHKVVEAAKETIHYTENLVRPSFHIPDNYGGGAEERTESGPTARLELGTQTEYEAYVEPKTTRVGKEEAKIVHYSAPVVQTDPFAVGSPESTVGSTPEEAPQTPKPSVHPDNVVNLKDLPR